MDAQQPPPDDLSEDELRAAYEEQMKRVRVEDVLVQSIVSLLNLGGRRAGLSAGTESEKDMEQVRQAIDAVRALLPLVEEALGPDAKQLREVLSQLQLAYAQQAPAGAQPGGGPAGTAPAGEQPEGPGPAQSSGRLWIPGQ
jgi:hypothetical protein